MQTYIQHVQTTPSQFTIYYIYFINLFCVFLCNKFKWHFNFLNFSKTFVSTELYILQTADAKKVIKNFNKMASVLMEYEMLYHRSWCRAIESVKSGMHAALLIKHPESKELFVNLDPAILELIQEAKYIKVRHLVCTTKPGPCNPQSMQPVQLSVVRLLETKIVSSNPIGQTLELVYLIGQTRDG